MIKNILNIVRENVVLKVFSFILGYGLWSMVSFSRTAQCTLDIPVCFYGNTHVTIDAPEKITVTLKGIRNELSCLDLEHLAVHIDANKLHEGQQPFDINTEALFLPSTINVVYYKPLPCIVTVSSIQPLTTIS